MAIILEFRTTVDELARRPRRLRLRTAEIVIFPGVRYERWRDCDAKPDAPKTISIRDILKIVD